MGPKDWLKRESRYGVAIAQQMALPAVLACAYGLYLWRSSEKQFELTTFLNIVLPALFFVMWFVGVYERNKKHISDKDAFDGIHTNLGSLNESVSELLTFARSYQVKGSGDLDGQSFSARLMQGAERLLNQGEVLASLLQAGVAFENAMRGLARRSGVLNPEKLPLHRLIDSLKHKAPPEWHNELQTLRILRNQLSHAPEDEIRRISHPDILLNTYATAIDLINTKW